MTPPPIIARIAAAAVLLALQVAVVPPLSAAGIAWNAKLYNPRPQPDDVIVPMPCDGAMAFRRVAAPTAERPRDGFDALAGPFTDAEANGSPYVLVGKYEVAGNVWEWVQDCWNDSYRRAPRGGSPWESGDCGRRLLRGGSWDIRPWYMRSAFRDWVRPFDRDGNVGFRVAQDP